MNYFKFIYLVILSILLIPILEQNIHLFKIRPLQGAIIKAEEPELTRKGYFDYLSFQEQSEKYVNENFGFRNDLLRLRNQFYFSVLNQSPIPNYSIGKDKYLFENKYIDAYYGNNYHGDTLLEDLTYDIKLLQDTLAKHNITLLTIIAPSKAWFYPEFLPKGFDLTPEDTNTNYSRFCYFANEKKINLMDFNAVFLNQKDKSPFPLYTRNGTHWSFYAATISFDVILKKLEKLRGNKYPQMVYNFAETETSPNVTDNEVAKIFNLAINPPNSDYVIIPRVTFNKPGGYSPRVLGVTDSYYGVIDEMSLLAGCFKSADYWFAYQFKFPSLKYDPIKNNPDLLKTDLPDHEVVILMCTPHNIHGMGWGFIEEALQMYNTTDKKLNRYCFKDVIDCETKRYYLSHDAVWFQNIIAQARDNNKDIGKHFEEYVSWMVAEDRKASK